MKKGGEMILFPGNITFTGNNIPTQTFPALISDERLMIKTGVEKMLFSIDQTSDTVWVLTELYSTNPVTLTISKVKTSK